MRIVTVAIPAMNEAGAVGAVVEAVRGVEESRAGREAFDILVVARSSTGQSAGYHIQGLIENVGGTTSFIGTPSVTTLGEDVASWNAIAAFDDTNDALIIKVIGAGGGTIRWVATVRTAEVAW